MNIETKFDMAQGFYPSSPKAIKLLLKPYEWSKEMRRLIRYPHLYKKYDFGGNKTILEPSTGKCDIIDHINDNTNSKPEFLCIEKDNDLQNVIKGKGYRLIHDDFLTYENHYDIDIILMNPPFEEGTKHFLKAWEVVKPGGKISCILNAQTIKNPFSNERKELMKIVKENQFFECKIYSGLFDNAERKTSVEVAIIHVQKPKEENENPIFDQKQFSFEAGSQIKEFESTGQIEKLDFLGALIRSYHKGIEKFDQTMIAFNECSFFLRIFATYENEGFSNLIKSAIDETGNPKNNFVRSVKKMAWKYVINQLDVGKYFTKGVREKFDAFVKEQSDLEFTKENIFLMIDGIFQNRENILKESLLEVFDQLCAFDHKRNTHYVTGWKTNSAYKVNQKCIIPFAIKYGEYQSTHSIKEYGSSFNVNYYKEEFFRDLERVICHQNGWAYPMVFGTIRQALKQKFDELGNIKTGEPFDPYCESAIFKMKIHKKGTLHLEFKNRKVWQKFNIEVARYRGWLPDDINN